MSTEPVVCSIQRRHMHREFRAIREEPGRPEIFHRTMANALRALLSALPTTHDLHAGILKAMHSHEEGEEMSAMIPAPDSYERAVLEAREARAARDSKALSCALCAGQHALISLEAMLDYPGDLPPHEYWQLVAIATRLRGKLREAERLERPE